MGEKDKIGSANKSTEKNRMEKSEAFLRMEMLRQKAFRGSKMEIAGGLGILLLPVGLGLIYAGSNMREKANSEMDELYREVYVREPLEANFGPVDFNPLEGLSEERVEGFRICRMGNEFDSEAYGKVMVGDVCLEVSDVLIRDYDPSAKKDNLTTFFRGRMMVMEFPEKIASAETVFSKSFTNRMLSEEEERGKVDIENAVWNAAFEMYVPGREGSYDPVSLRLFKKLKSLFLRHRGIAMKIIGNQVILAVNDEESEPFYRRKSKDISLEDELAKVHADFRDVKEMIRLLSGDEG